MNDQPKTIEYEAMAIEALEMMENNNVSQLLVIKADLYVGIIHIHELLKEGII